MKIEEFRSLEDSIKVEMVNKRLEELAKDKKTTKDFKNESIDFSYTTATNEMENIGYSRKGKVFQKEINLSAKEIALLVDLAKNYEFLMQKMTDKPDIKLRKDDKINTTSVRMYAEVWGRWQEFAKEWPIYNSVDLMASALEEYMNKFKKDDEE